VCAEGEVLLKRWDKEQEEEQDARFWFLLGGYRSKNAAEKGLDESEGNVVTQLVRSVAVLVRSAGHAASY